jgi:tetratricopeptide (TPR) repeat protein
MGLDASDDEQARAAAHPTENFDAYQHYLKGRNFLRGSQNLANIKQAITEFEASLKSDSRFALAYTGLADASLVGYRQTKDPAMAARALSAAEQARQINDRLAEVHLTLGSVYNATGKTAEANAELQEALKLAPASDEAYRRLAQNYLGTNRPAEGYAALQKAIAINPYFWLNYYELALAYMNQGSYDKADAAARKVVELDPENAVGYEAEGLVAFQQGKYQQSVPLFEKSLQIQPNYTNYSNLGTAQFFLKHYPEAVKMYEKAVEMNPQDQINLGNLADAYRVSQQPALAKTTYERAISAALKDLRVNPRNSNTLGSLALYYAKSGRAADALAFIRRARSVNTTDVNLIYNQAVVQALGKDDAGAVKSLGEAFAKGYSPEEAKNDPEFAGIQGRQDFKDVVARYSAKK